MQNIISALGAGSGIDTQSLVEQLVEIEKAPKQTRIDNSKEKIEAQISGFGLIRSALATFQDAVDSLGDPESFNAKSATFTDSTALLPSSLADNAQVGDYTFDVQKIAQAQSLRTDASFTDSSDAVGKGTLTFRFGGWDATTDNFTVDADVDAKVITIDDSNNSLSGLRDAINDADMGVQASIINDGTGNRLVITAPSGDSKQIEIVVDEGGLPADNVDATGLSQFAFGEGAAAQQLVQNQAGVDAELIVNGFTVYRSSNKIDDIIEGFSFDLAKAAPGEVVSITIFDDKAAAQDAVRGFVEAYNTLKTEMEALTGYDDELEEYGSLHRDTTMSSLMTSLRNSIANAVPAVQGDFTALTNVGIRTALDGSLEIDEEDFKTGFDDYFQDIKSLFAPQTNSTSDKIVVNGYGANTVPGNYDIVITQDPVQGTLAGAAAAGTLLADLAVATSSGSLTGTAPTVAGTLIGTAALPPLDLASQGAGVNDYDFSITIDGVASAADISLVVADYADYDAMAADLQTAINADANLSGVTVAYDTDHFVVTSGTTGTSSSVAVTAVGTSIGLDTGVSGFGTDGANDYDFSITVDGTASGTISLAAGSYATFADMAADMQTQINADVTLSAAGAAVDVVHDGSQFVVTSRLQSEDSSVSAITVIGAEAGKLGLDSLSTPVLATGTGKDYEFTIDVNGKTSAAINIPSGTYTNTELATEIQSRINADVTLQAAGADVDVSYNAGTGGFDITTRDFGSKTSVAVTNVGGNAADLGLAAGTSAAGKDTFGTVGGVAGFGVGNILLPKLDSDPYGLSFTIKPGASASTVTYSRGFGMELSQLLDGFLQSSGVFDNREDGLKTGLSDLKSDQSDLDRKISAYHDRLTAQYIAMERIVSSLQGSGSFLDGILDRLPYTSSSG